MELRIDNLGPKGDGISRGKRGPVYVERGLPGERVKANVKRDRFGNYRAEIITIVNRSPARQKPPCPHYEKCGGCTLQHANQKAYQHFKVEMVKEALTKAGVRTRRFLPAIFLGGGNRRRATFAAYKQEGEVTIGYYRRRSAEVTEINECLVADPKILQVKEALRPHLKNLLFENEPIDIFVQLIHNKVDLVLTGAVNPKAVKDLPADRVHIRLGPLNEMRPVKIVPMVEKFENIHVNLPPAAFLQPTKEGERALQQAILKAIPADAKTFADLFSGCGTFSGPLLKRGTVDAFEENLPSVKALAATKHPNLQIFRRDLIDNPLRREDLNRYDVVIFDPPRAGAKEQCEKMASSRVKTVIGVSCNPATFARDAKILTDGGYFLESVQPIDQFHYSHHVEVVGVFRKRFN